MIDGADALKPPEGDILFSVAHKFLIIVYLGKEGKTVLLGAAHECVTLRHKQQSGKKLLTVFIHYAIHELLCG